MRKRSGISGAVSLYRQVCICVLAGIAYAQDGLADPLMHAFAVRNQNPFVGVYNIATMRSIESLSPGSSSIDFSLDISSSFTSSEVSNEFIRMDGETYRAAIRYARALDGNWSGGIEIPVLAHDGGFLDSFIIDWHDTFNLPQLGRDRAVNNRLSYLYQRDGIDRIRIESAGSGLGDIAVFVSRKLSSNDGPARLHAQLKLPTGDPDRLFGSGGFDASMWWQTSSRFGRAFSGDARVGVAYLGPGDVLPDLQRHWVGFGGLHLAWSPHPIIALKAQIDVHTPIYHGSEIDQLTDTAIQITVGGSLRLGRRGFFDFGVMEDEANPDVAPDVGFHVRLRWSR